MASCNDDNCSTYIESSDEDLAKALGMASKYFVVSVLFLSLVAAVVTKDKANCSTGVWRMYSYVQYAKWVFALDLEQSAFLLTWAKEFVSVFTLDFTKPAYGESPQQTRFKDVYQTDTHLMLGNADFSLAIVIVGVTFHCVGRCFKAADPDSVKGLIKKLSQHSALIRTCLLVCMDLAVFSALQLYSAEFTSPVFAISFIVSVVFIISLGASTFVFPLLIHSRLSLLNDKDIAKASDIHSLVSEFSLDQNFYHYQFYSFYMLQRFFVGLSIVLLYEYPTLIYFFMCFEQLSIVLFLVIFKPMKRKLDSLTCIVAECVLFVVVVYQGVYFKKEIEYSTRLAVDQLWISLFLAGFCACIASFMLMFKPVQTHKIVPQEDCAKGSSGVSTTSVS